VRNLLSNAVKFTPAGGTVTLSVEPVGVDGKHLPADETVTLPVEPCGEGKYTVAVSDTGIGMDSDQLGKLFRLDSARSRKGTAGEQGSGLGLIVCKDLLEKHGSVLHVESEAGKGSTFWFIV
jgi:signal transduction histidine kinase